MSLGGQVVSKLHSQYVYKKNLQPVNKLNIVYVHYTKSTALKANLGYTPVCRLKVRFFLPCS